MKVGTGLKATELGVVPEDWAVSRLQDLTSFISYGFTNPMPTTESGVYMITARDINHGKIQFGGARCTTEDAYRTLLTAKSRPRSGDVLLTKDGTLGRLALVNDTTVCINQSVAILRPNAKADSEFLKVLLESPVYQSRMIEDAGGSTIKHIYITIVNQMPVAFPPALAEQEAIAEALSDADTLIESLEQLLTKKRQIKQGAMQELLTGKRRLPGFGGKWETTKLGKIARIQRGASPRPIDNPIWFDENSSVGWVRISDVTCSGMYLRETTQRLSHLGIKNSRPVDRGNLIMSICATVGRPIITELDVCIHDGFVVFDDLNADRDYVYYVLASIESNWSRHGQTGSQMNLNTELINRTMVSIPRSNEEQRAIAEVFSDVDTEIAAIEGKLTKAQQIKQGMMQELLTGRIRLIR